MRSRNYCPFCGSTSLSPLKSDDGIKCHQCGEVVYFNSKPSATGVFHKERKVLLVRDLSNSGWDLPGGFLNHGESPEIGLKREIREELGVEIEISGIKDAIVDVYGDQGEFSLNLFYEIESFHGEITPLNEIVEAEWFSLDDLPHLEYLSITTFFRKFFLAS